MVTMTNTKEIQTKLQNGAADAMLLQLYAKKPAEQEAQRQRYIKAVQRYEELFGEDEVAIFSAPGRTEIGGNHTDHQRGKVLAASVDMDAIAIVGMTDKNEISIVSEGHKTQTISLDSLDKREDEEGCSASLIRGVAAGLQERGYKVGPFRTYITSNVINGAGLSSSAAFETLVGTILSGLYNDMQVSAVEIAQIGQYAENVYFGKPCGLMDQMACSVGNLVSIDLFDAENPVVRRIDYDMSESGYSLCIVDTKGSHADLTPDYAAVPAEMKAVAAYFGKEVLTQIDEAEFLAAIPKLREDLGDRAVLRAIHFYGETKRAADEADALQNSDFDAFLRTFRASADSSYKYLQNVYSNGDAVKHQAVPVALALSELILGDKGVARVHGGGFAGTIQVFVKNDYVDTYKTEIEKYMGEGTCHLCIVRKHGGVHVL